MDAEVFDIKPKTTFTKIKNHLKENKMGYVMTGVAIGVFALMQNQRRNFEEFLEEKGIDKLEFYIPEYYNELKNNK